MSYDEQVAALSPLQLRGDGAAGGDGGDPHTAAARGVRGSGGALPHLDAVQASFGHHDVSTVKAHVGGPASEATQALGAKAYATGDHVAFREAPDLSTAAHEAAHIVQQRSGVQLKGGVGSAGDAYEKHADAVADKVVRGESAAALLDQGAARGGGAPVQRKASGRAPVQRKVTGGASLSATKGLTITFAMPSASMNVKLVKLANPSVTANVKPTKATEIKTRPEDETTGGVGVSGGGMKGGYKYTEGKEDAQGRADEHEFDYGSAGDGSNAGYSGEKQSGKDATHKGADLGGKKPALTAAIKKKWGSTVFTDAAGEVGMNGGNVAVTAGGEWKNAVLSCTFTLLSIPGGGKNIKFLTATAKGKARGIVTVDGVNFEVSLTLSIDVKPNTTALAKVLVKKGIVASMRNFGKLAGQVGALPFLFVEGGYETLKAAYKNVVAAKEIPKFVDTANFASLKVGQHFVNGVLGKSTGMGSKSGMAWFERAFQVTKADHPDITKAEFRDALQKAPSWQEQAKIEVARQIRAVLFAAWQQEMADTVAAKDMEHVKSMLFGGAEPPDVSGGGPGVSMPEIVKKKDPGKVDLPDQQSRADEAPVPPAIKGEVKHRVKNHQRSGTIPYQGVTYHFEFKAPNRILVHGGPKSSVVTYRPPWLGQGG